MTEPDCTDMEYSCIGREDGIHCDHWWDGEACCNCKAPAMTPEEIAKMESEQREDEKLQGRGLCLPES